MCEDVDDAVVVAAIALQVRVCLTKTLIHEEVDSRRG
jgi:hypothetical protein